MYRVAAGAGEVAAATHLVTDSAERLRRLRRAYAAWQEFEAGPYFDLTEPQLGMLAQVQERMTTVHVALTLDLLLPSVQAAVDWYLVQWQPIAGAPAATQYLRADEWPPIHAEMQQRWAQACATIAAPPTGVSTTPPMNGRAGRWQRRRKVRSGSRLYRRRPR